MENYSKYAKAFCTAFAVPLITVLGTGQWPGQTSLLQAFAAGLVGTGLFHMTSPKDQTPS